MVTGFNAGGEVDGEKWRKYSDDTQRFKIEHPSNTEPKSSQSGEPGLLFRAGFDFEQPFNKGTDSGTLKFRFQVSIWENTNQLSAEAWAGQHFNPKLIQETHPTRLAGRKALVLRASNLAWTSVNHVVADHDRIYELSHVDLAANKLLLSEAIRARWTAMFSRMLESFRLLPAVAESKSK